MTLRDAINTVINGFNNPVSFTVGGAISLKAALPVLSKNIDIDGPGSANLTVQGNGNVFNPYRIFTVNPGVTSLIDGLTISGGFDITGLGGGIYNQGKLTLDDVILENNQTWGNGGGIANAGNAALYLQDVTLQNNKATRGGGGLYNKGTATMDHGMFSGNTAGMGGGVYNSSGVVTLIDNSQIVGNTATGVGGGGVYNWSTFNMDGGTVSGNKAIGALAGWGNGGGILQRLGTMNLTSVQVQDNHTAQGSQGGGIYVFNGILNLNSATIGGPARNTAGDGGGLYERDGSVRMVDGSISNNSATISGVGAGVQNGGGGLFVGGGSLTLRSVTVQNNTSRSNGGGIDMAGTSGTPSVKITGGMIEKNGAWNSGGGLYTSNGALTLTNNGNPGNNVIVNDNNAANQGGGFYLGNGSTTTFNGVNVSGNTASAPANGNGVYWQWVNGAGGATVNPDPPIAPALNDGDDGPRGPIKAP